MGKRLTQTVTMATDPFRVRALSAETSDDDTKGERMIGNQVIILISDVDVFNV